MGCIFRVGGVDLDVDACLRECDLAPYAVFRKGEEHFKRVYRESGFKIRVSEADFDDLPQQIEDAISFLETSSKKLRKLRDFPNVRGSVLDFPITERDVAVQCDVLPSRLLKLAGNLGIDIKISRYPISNDVPVNLSNKPKPA